MPLEVVKAHCIYNQNYLMKYYVSCKMTHAILSLYHMHFYHYLFKIGDSFFISESNVMKFPQSFLHIT